MTARMPGSAAILRCQRASSASLRLVVIGPRSVAATRMKGASQPGPTAASIVSAFWRAWLEVGSSSIPGAPVVKASVGAISRTSGTATRTAASAGLRSAARAAPATVHPTPPLRGSLSAPVVDLEPRNGAGGRRRPIRPALMRGPSSPSSGGTARVETTTLITATTAVAVASESSSVPGCRKAEKTRATISVVPAKKVVRPALPRVAAAASQGPSPPSSSSRKRETISSE